MNEQRDDITESHDQKQSNNKNLISVFQNFEILQISLVFKRVKQSM